MSNLLSAGFSRLKGDRTFRLGMLVMALLGLLIPIIRYIDTARSGYEASLDASFFAYAVFIVIVSSVFCGLYFGTDYSDGTIRNKIAVGHGRAAVYFSNLLVSFAAVILMQIAYMIPAFAAGIPLLGLEIGMPQRLYLILAILLMSMAFSSIFTLISALCQNKAIIAVICIMCMFILLFAGVYTHSRLDEPEFYSAYSYTDSQGTTSEGEEPNPNYISGTKRAAYEFMFDLNPGGQTIQLAGAAVQRPERLPVCSLAVIAATTAAGIFLFRKKDIK